jgi:hypothetical protein
VGRPGQYRPLGIPTIYDRVCQQAMLNRLQPIFEPVFDEDNFGYRAGRSTKDALSKIWQELEQGNDWVVDADLKDFFGSDPSAYPAQGAGEHSGAYRSNQSGHSWVGSVFLQGPRARTFPPT